MQHGKVEGGGVGNGKRFSDLALTRLQLQM